MKYICIVMFLFMGYMGKSQGYDIIVIHDSIFEGDASISGISITMYNIECNDKCNVVAQAFINIRLLPETHIAGYFSGTIIPYNPKEPIDTVKITPPVNVVKVPTDTVRRKVKIFGQEYLIIREGSKVRKQIVIPS